MRRVKEAVARLRARSRLLDQVLRMLDHYGTVRGGILAGGVTYFGFLSFFPILALAFFVIGYVKQVAPGSEDALKTAIEQILPGIISDRSNPPAGQISFQQIQDAKAVAGIVGVLGVLYAGLGWLSALRQALVATFEVPQDRQANFVVGKLRDLVMLAVIGVVLIASVGVAGVVTGYASDILDVVDLPDPIGGILLWALAIVLGVGASTLLFFTMYRLLSATPIPASHLWRGALLAAVAFEILKQLAFLVLNGAGGSAFAPLALSLTLVIWIYYFARITIYGASWAFVSATPSTTAAPSVTAVADGRPSGAALAASTAPVAAAELDPREPAVGWARPALVVGTLVVAVWAWVRREKQS